MTTPVFCFVIGLAVGGLAGSLGGFFLGFKRGCANGNHHALAFWKRKTQTERQ